jgi:antitoxin (DNA-binding transcriptional repressor) of toxin-antitoxin stability system
VGRLLWEEECNLSKLAEEAEAGEDIVLARAGTPVVRLVPIQASRRRKLGRWKGKVVKSEDFDAPFSEAALAAWEGRG